MVGRRGSCIPAFPSEAASSAAHLNIRGLSGGPERARLHKAPQRSLFCPEDNCSHGGRRQDSSRISGALAGSPRTGGCRPPGELGAATNILRRGPASNRTPWEPGWPRGRQSFGAGHLRCRRASTVHPSVLRSEELQGRLTRAAPGRRSCTVTWRPCRWRQCFEAEAMESGPILQIGNAFCV